jgi:hypothetical protein
LPAGVSGSSVEGNTSGTLILNAGTKIQFLYTSTILNGSYTLSVSISNSDSQSKSSNIVLPGQNGRKTDTNITAP